MESLVLISDIVFIKKGVPKAIPDKAELASEDLSALIQGNIDDKSDDSENDERAEEQRGTTEGSGRPNVTSDVNMDEEQAALEDYLKEYDEEEEQASKKKRGAKKSGTAMYTNPMDDPYLTKNEDSEEEEEKDDFIVRPTDNFVVAGKVDKGQYSLVVRIFNENDGDYYVHHDYILEAPPLCLEPFHYDPGADGKQGNLLAVGTMSGAIEVWDLDIVNAIEPAIILGGSDPESKKKKNRKKRDNTAQGHTEAVLSCRWNQQMHHVLASGDADGNLILWDIDEAKPNSVIDATSQGGIQSLHWHPVESSVLLSGSMGGVIAARDCRTEQIAATWSLGDGTQVEKVLWDHFSPFYAIVASDDGMLRYVDMRKTSEFVHCISAHDGGVNAIGLSCSAKGLLATGGADGNLAVWSVNSGGIDEVHRAPLSLGNIHSLAFSPNSPFIVAVGGEKDDLSRVIDVSKYSTVATRFQ